MKVQSSVIQPINVNLIKIRHTKMTVQLFFLISQNSIKS